MKLPIWTPAWAIRALDVLLGIWFEPGFCQALQCDCGAIIDKEEWMTEDDLEVQLEAHNRFFHPERVTPRPQ